MTKRKYLLFSLFLASAALIALAPTAARADRHDGGKKITIQVGTITHKGDPPKGGGHR